MMKILKASAGSGKTYRLTQTYLDYLFRNGKADAYRNILAVTFTNKATDEMKSRILKELHSLSAEDPKARSMLINILHDYSSFSISTIDKFFQQTLKAFSREIGQFADYQVELDKKSLIHEAIDRILDELTEDQTELIAWMKTLVMNQLNEGKKVNIENDLYEAAERLKSSEFTSLCEKWSIDPANIFSKDNLSLIRKVCNDAGKTENEQVTLTAKILKEQTYSLGIVREFFARFDNLLKEKNVMVLDESNKILKDIIDGSDAPFIYEKMGVRYEHFLLDEFQDTSIMQWDNFLPLIRESESRGFDNLVVGDIKQSIYRWRGSDWNLLATGVKKQISSAKEEPMKDNWRSTCAVVDFNNEFYKYASSQIDRVLALQTDPLNLSAIYNDVHQDVKKEEAQQGYVKISMVEKDDTDATILESIKTARDAGARYGDIAILVRTNAIGSQIASLLISAGINVISDDSLQVKSSIIVRRLISLLSGAENPDDSLGSFLSSELEIDIPESYHSLVDLCEEILRALYRKDTQLFEGEIPYIQSFMDTLQDWVSINGNNLLLFLKYWKGIDPSLASPKDSHSVRIITIHKSKGLEYPYVIFPNIGSSNFYKPGVHWSHPDLAGTTLEGKAEGIYPVMLKQETNDTLFRADYLNEKKMQAVDNINVFYVATTRATKCLHIIAVEPTTKAFRQSVDNGKDYPFKDFSQLLYAFCRNHGHEFGKMYDFTKMDRDEPTETDFSTKYPSIPIGQRLKPSSDALDFFGEDGSVGGDASQRLAGIELHEILSIIRTTDDLDKVKNSRHYDFLRGKVLSRPELFPSGSEARILNETSIIDTDGTLHRPDRVIVSKQGSVRIVDYKFGGSDKKHKEQISKYVSLYRAMGYSEVRGYLWYVFKDKLIEVN